MGVTMGPGDKKVLLRREADGRCSVGGSDTGPEYEYWSD
jgi:hypothetical protein